MLNIRTCCDISTFETKLTSTAAYSAIARHACNDTVTAQDERYGDLDKLAIFGGSVYPEMASDICRLLGIEPGKVRTYANL